MAYLGDTTARGSFDCVIKNMQDGNTTNYMSEVSAIGVYMWFRLITSIKLADKNSRQ